MSPSELSPVAWILCQRSFYHYQRVKWKKIAKSRQNSDDQNV